LSGVTGPLNTSQLNFIAKRHTATSLQSSGSACSADSNPDTSLDELVETHCGHHMMVHTADTSYTAVDIFHAYCALAVVRHRLAVRKSTLSSCKDELTECQVAGLCRLLLWDVDMCQRRRAEELLYIQQLKTNMSVNRNQPAVCHSDKASDGSVTGTDISQDTTVGDELSSQTSSHDEPSVMIRPDSVDECGAAVVDHTEVNIGTASCSDWQTLPVDVKYSKCELSVELLEQEADRLQHLCNDTSLCTVITYDMCRILNTV